MIDYLIVGSGLFGSVFARQMTDRGAKCVVIDKRSHIGGNCYSEKIEGIETHKYGPHIFHTDSEKVWSYINRFASFNKYRHRPKVRFEDEIYSFPINLMTLYQMFGVKTPEEALLKLNDLRIESKNPSNLEEWAISQIGLDLYEKFVKGYTKKQWGRDPKDLPSFIIRRLPIRLNFDDDYFDDRYQGIPIGGYTKIFENLLEGIEVRLNENYFDRRDFWNSFSKKIVYTGPIDEFFNCDEGTLEWRSLRFKTEILKMKDFQGSSIVNYTHESIPYTRIVEHKHFEFNPSDITVITKEFPQEWKKEEEKFYPINDERNTQIYNKYKSRIDHTKFIFGGRLAQYKYYDMHQVIASALASSEKEIF